MMAGSEGGQRGGAPVRGFARNLVGKSVSISRDGKTANSCFAVKSSHQGVEGVVLVRRLKAFEAGGGREERWFVPWSAFGSVKRMCEEAQLVN